MLQEGDLLLHFPGDFKSALPQYLQLQQNQILHSGATRGAEPARRTLSAAAAAAGAISSQGSRRQQSGYELVHSHDVPCFAVFGAHMRGSTDTAASQAAQQHADMVDVSLVTIKQQGISTTTKVASITISIQQQQQHALSRFGFQQHAHNIGWPIALPSVPALAGRFGALHLQHSQHQPHGVRSTDIDP
jgi:hypothetical protein